MDLQLKGLTAMVSGATRGIGRAIAETLAAEGANVSICARHDAEVQQTVAALTAKGGKALGSAIDVADGAALQRWVDANALSRKMSAPEYWTLAPVTIFSHPAPEDHES